jgi:hypothetical protein
MNDQRLINANELNNLAFDIADVDGQECCVVSLFDINAAPTVDAIVLTPDYKPGDVCLYIFDNGNNSSAIVEIVRILNDERGVAEIKFLKVFVDDTGNGFFDYLLRTNQTMNASFKYLKNITPR